MPRDAMTNAPEGESFVRLRDLSVEVSPISRSSTWKQLLLGRESKLPPPIRVLDGISLEIRNGERLLIVGRNGAGKTSLVKAISGIYPPTSGEREISGRIAPIVSTQLGFDYELGAVANVALTMAHMDRFEEFTPELAARIIEFAELTGREGTPIKKLSSGQQARLAFSIVLHAPADILILDEVLTTGDVGFLEKAQEAMFRKIAETAIVIMVSHELGRASRLATRAVWVSGGKILADGDVDSVVGQYEAAVREHRI